MADWVSGVKDVIANFLCGRITPTSASSVSLEGCELEMVSGDHPLPDSTMIKFTAEDSSDDSSPVSSDLEDDKDGATPNGKAASQGEVRVHCKPCPDIPVRTKAAQGVFLGGQLYVGGGYMEDSKLSTVIHKFDSIFELWDSLPPCPVKMFGMSSFNQQLVLVGGKEVGRLGSSYSNKLFTWDSDGHSWSNTLPAMTFARMCPVAISYDQYLIVAGGKKGSLDFNMEVYNSNSKRWTSAPPLPVKCFPSTSAVAGSSWYLLNLEDGTIVSAHIPSLLEQVTGANNITANDKSMYSEDIDIRSKLWTQLPKLSCEPTQITTLNGRLLAIANENNPVKVSSYIFDNETGNWLYSHKLPNLCGRSSTLPDAKDGTYLFGGEGGLERYSNKLYRLTLRQSSVIHDCQTKGMKPPITFSL